MGVEDRLKGIIVDILGVDEEDVVADAEWMDLGADSQEIAELVAATEEEFGVELADADVEALETVGDAIAYLRQNAGD